MARRGHWGQSRRIGGINRAGKTADVDRQYTQHRHPPDQIQSLYPRRRVLGRRHMISLW